MPNRHLLQSAGKCVSDNGRIIYIGSSTTAYPLPGGVVRRQQDGSPADYSPQIVSQVEQAGYRIGFTTNPGACMRHMDPLALNRVCIPGKLSTTGLSKPDQWLTRSIKKLDFLNSHTSLDCYFEATAARAFSP